MFSVTKHAGFVRSLEYFNRQVFSRDTGNYKIVRRGDLAYAMIHLDEGSLGILRDADAGLISPMYTVFEPDRSQAAPEFLFALMKLPQMVARYQRIGEGTVHRRKSISLERLGRLTIAMPPLSEQRRILAVLDAIDEAIERTEEVIGATERLRDALLHELLTRGLPGRHSEWADVPGLGTVPACWDVAAIGRCLERIEAGSSPRCESRPARDDEWGVLKVSSVSWGVFQPTENKALLQPSDIVPRYEVRDGDLILSRANTPDLVGRAVRVRTTPPRLLLSDKTLRLVPDPARIDPEFLLSSLRLPRSRSQIIGAATGSSRSMFNVSQDSVRKMRVALPPLEEQQAIADALENVEASIERAGEERAGLQSLQASAADALLTGRVRVREAIRDRHGQA